MSHEDFVQYISEGATIAGRPVVIAAGQEGHQLRIDRSRAIPLAFEPNEGFESRMEKVVAALKLAGERRRTAA